MNESTYRFLVVALLALLVLVLVNPVRIVIDSACDEKLCGLDRSEESNPDSAMLTDYKPAPIGFDYISPS